MRQFDNFSIKFSFISIFAFAKLFIIKITHLLVSIFSLLGLILLLKNINWINNTILLFALGILIGSIIPFLIRKKQRKSQGDDRP